MVPYIVIATLTTTSFVYPGPYLAEVNRVIDGDTVNATVLVWPGFFTTVGVRLDGVNAPEIRTKRKCEKTAGLAAKKFVEEVIGDSLIELRQVKRGKYGGRVIAEVWVNGENLSALLLKAGMARRYDGTSHRKPWCSEL